VNQGFSAKEAAETVGLGISWVREIINRYNKEGPQAVEDQHEINPGGKKPRLDHELQDELLEALKEKPPGGGVWTGPKVAAWIENKTKIKTYPQLGWVYLRSLTPKIKQQKPYKARAADGKNL
jgi:transposase